MRKDMKEERMDPRVCICGHVEDEHGPIPGYPGAKVCKVETCNCTCFEPADGDDDPGLVIE